MLLCGKPKNLTATGNVSAGSCQLLGYYINSTNAGTLVLRQGGSSGTALGTITPAIGWHWYPLDCDGALHATIGGSALDVTFIFKSTGAYIP